MDADIRNAIDEQLGSIQGQWDNAIEALETGDTSKLRKALEIIGKVARIVLVVLAALEQAKGKA